MISSFANGDLRMLDGQTVLITGANGFLGKHLLERLALGGCRLHAISRSSPAETGTVRWWRGDLTDIHWVREVMSQIKPGIIYHLASASVGGQGIDLVLPTFDNDLRTTVHVLVTAQQLGCSRVIITRSLDEPRTHEFEMQAPPSPYAAAKVASGFYGRMFHQLYGVPVVMLRPFMTYGPGQKDHKIIPYTVQAMLRGEHPSLASGERRVDWIYVDDVISAFLTAATKQEAIGKEIDLGSGSLVSIRDVVEQISGLIPSAPRASFGSLPDRVLEQVRVADTETALSILGWKAATSLREGLSQTIEWYRERLTQCPVAAI